MQQIDYAHLIAALDSVKQLSNTSFSIGGYSYLARPDDVDIDWGLVNLWRRDWLVLYALLLEAIEVAEAYERVGEDLLEEIDARAVALMKYAPADKWNGQFSATSAAVNALIRFRRMFASEEYILDDLRQKHDLLAKMRIDSRKTASDYEREIDDVFCRDDWYDTCDGIREAMRYSLKDPVDRIADCMRSWFPEPLVRAVKMESRLFGDVVIDPADKNDSPERAAPEEWEFASTFLEAAMELGAHEKPVCSERIWEKAGFSIGDQKDVDTGNADLTLQRARDICRWLASGAKGRKLELQVGLGLIEPQGRRGYLLTAKGVRKARRLNAEQRKALPPKSAHASSSKRF